MKKFLKVIGSLAVVLVVLVVALAIAVPMLFDINDQKDKLVAAVKEETGRDLVVEGDLELTVFPWLGVRAGAMSLAHAPGFAAEQPFAAFESASVQVKLIPLLFRREVQVGQITLDGFQLHLERDADGRANWDDLVEADGTAESRPSSTHSEFDLAKLEIAGISLRDARISYRDAQAGVSYAVEELQVSTGAIRAGAPIELDMSARVTSGVPQWRGIFAFTGRADYAHDARTMDFIVERATADLEGGALPVARLQANLVGRVQGDLEGETWQFDGFELGVVARGGKLPDRDFPARITGSARADLAAQTAVLSGFAFEGFGLRANLTGAGARIKDAPEFTGSITVEPFSPRQVLADLGQQVPETKDPTALTHLQFAAQYDARRNSVALTGLSARLDASTLTGRFAVADFSRQALRFDLALDQLDLDRYLPPEIPETDEVAAGSLDAIRIPDTLIRRLDIDGSAQIARLRAFGIASEEVTMTVKALDGLLRVHPAGARLYGGTYVGDISVDVRRDVPRVSINERLTGVESGAMFGDLYGQSRITGVADLSAALAGSGHTVGEVRQTLDGRVAFSFRDGAVKGVDVWHRIRDARAVFRREERPPAPEGEPQTAFGSLSGTGTVRRGVVTNDDFRAVLPFMNAAGAGTIDLARREIDYRLRVTVQDTPGVDGGEGTGELRGKTIPLAVSGPFDQLSYGVDVSGILREQVDEARQRLEDRLREELRRRIR